MSLSFGLFLSCWWFSFGFRPGFLPSRPHFRVCVSVAVFVDRIHTVQAHRRHFVSCLPGSAVACGDGGSSLHCSIAECSGGKRRRAVACSWRRSSHCCIEGHEGPHRGKKEDEEDWRIARWRRRGRRRRRRRRKRKGEEEEALRNSVSGSEMGFPGGVLAGLRPKKHQHRFSGGLLLAGRPFSMLSESSRNPTRNPDSRHGCGIV